MSAVHRGNSAEVINMGNQLRRVVSLMLDTDKEGRAILGKMNGSVNDNAYNRAEEIVDEVSKLIRASKDDLIEVATKVKEYGDYLDSIS